MDPRKPLKGRGPQAEGMPLGADISIQAGDLILQLSREGRIIHVNEEAAATFGYTVEQMLGVPIEVICPRLQSSPVRFDIGTIMAGRDFVGGFECARRDGTSLSLYMYATAGTSLPPDQSGKKVVAGVFCVAREVTAFWQAEEAVRASREKYRLLFDLSPDMVVLTATDGRIVEANQAVSLRSGYSAEQLRSMSILDLVPAEAKRKAELVFAGLWHRKRLKSVLEFQTSDGKAVLVEFNASINRIDGKPMVFAIGRDVSDRVQIERRAQEIGEKYERVFDAIRDGVFLETMDGRILDVNRAACDQLGYSREELLRKSAADLIPVEARSWLPNIREVLLREGDLLVEAVNVRKDGTELPVEVRCSRVELGGQTLVLVMTRDISERKESETAIRQSEEQLRTLQDNVPVGIFRTNPEGTLLMVNATAVRMYGYGSSEEMLTKTAADLYADAADRDKTANQLARNGWLAGLEIEMKRKDGTKFWGSLDARLVTDKSGTPRFFDGTVQDVTDRRNAEEEARQGLEALRESKQRYSTLFMGTPIGMYRTTPDGRVLMANPAVVKMLGYSSFSELQSRNLEQEGFHPGYSREEFKQRVEREGKIAGLESEWTRKDGSTVYVRENARVVRADDGEVLYYEGTVEDITGVKKSTEALRDREARLSLMVERLPAVLWTVDVNLVFTSSVGAGLAALGLEPGQVVGMSLYDYFNTQDPGFPAIAAHRRALEGKTADFSFEWSGNAYQSRVEPLFDSNGTIVGAIGIAHDVTGQTRAEKRAGALLQSIPQAVVYQTGGGTEYVSPNVVDMLGYDADEFVRDRGLFPSLIHPEDSNRVADNFAEWLRYGAEGVLTQEFRVRDKSGEYVRVADHAQLAYRTEDGRSSTLGVLVDMTESRKSRDQLSGKEQRYRKLFDAVPCSASVCQDGKVILANRAMAEMFGCASAEELVGRPAKDFVHPEDRTLADEWQRTLLSGVNTGKSLEPLSVRFLDKDGRTVPVEIVGSLVEWDGLPAVQVIVSPAQDF